MARGRNKLLYWDKRNKSWNQFHILPDGSRKKVYLCSAKSKTRDPEAKAKALNIWSSYCIAHKLTQTQRRKERDRKIKDGMPLDSRGCRTTLSMIGCIDRWLLRQSTRVHNGEMSSGRMRSYQLSARVFTDWVGKRVYDDNPERGARQYFTHERLSGFLQYLKKVSNPDYKPPQRKTKANQFQCAYNTAKLIWWCIQDLFHWVNDKGWSNYKPRTRYLTFRKPKKNLVTTKPTTFTPEELHLLLSTKNPYSTRYDLRLFILLGLNCGFTSRDIATMRYNNLVFDNDGHITRVNKQRVKTGVSGSWKLMKATSQLLQTYLAKNPHVRGSDFLFETKEGNLLVRYTEKHTRVDYIYLQMRKLLNKLDIRSRSFKHLRSTGATLIAEFTQGQFPLYESLFLAHAVPTTARQYYVAIDPNGLDPYITKMEEFLFPEQVA